METVQPIEGLSIGAAGVVQAVERILRIAEENGQDWHSDQQALVRKGMPVRGDDGTMHQTWEEDGSLVVLITVGPRPAKPVEAKKER